MTEAVWQNSSLYHPTATIFEGITSESVSRNFYANNGNTLELRNHSSLSESTLFEYSTDNGTNLSTPANFEDDAYIFDRDDVQAIFLALCTIVFCSCFFGNLMVILVVTLHWRMRSITNFCLANLAFADLCVGIFCVYQSIVPYLMDSWVFGEFMCKMYHFINSLSTTASVLILVVICIERYLAIIHPMTCKQMLTLNRLRITIIFVWILSAVISCPRLYYIGTITMPVSDDHEEILCVPDRQKYNSRLVDMISLTMLFLIPLTIISILYTHIGIVLFKSSRARMAAFSATPSVESSSSNDHSCFRESVENIMVQSVKLTQLPNDNQQEVPAQATAPCANNSYSSPQLESVSCLRCQRRPRKLRFKSIRRNILSSECNQEVETSFINSRAAHRKCENVVKNSEVEQDSPQSTSSCCTSRKGILCSRLKSKSLESTNSETPQSPFCGHNCSCLDHTIACSKTEPIVLVRFEEKGRNKLPGMHHRKESYCTFLLNKNKCHKDLGYGSHDKCCPLLAKDDNDCVSCNLKRNPSVDSGISGMRLCSGQTVSQRQSVSNGKFAESDSQDIFENEPKLVSSEKCHNHSSPHTYDSHHYHHQQNGCSHHERVSSSSSALPKCPPKRPRRMRVVRSSKYGTSALQSRRKIIRMLIVVVLTFAVCHLPFHARKVWQYWSPTWAPYKAGGVFSTLFTPVTFLIMYANSGINPILYAFMSKKFRMSFRDLLCCRMRHSLRISRNASLKSTHAVPLSQTVL